jgi:prepilin-type N-terminal cleavage/methylation domain-containing protein
MKIKTSRKGGFTLVEIMIVVAIIGLLAAIAIPNFLRARSTSQQNACINNLRQIDGAIQQWALESKAKVTDPVTGPLIQPYMGRGSTGSLPYCPLDSDKNFTSSYSVKDASTPPMCRQQDAGVNGQYLHRLLQ